MTPLRLLLVAAIVLADIASKTWAANTLQGNPPIALTPFLRLIYVENPGAAFGILAAADAKWLLLAIAIILCTILAVVMHRSQSSTERTAAALIIAGAIGNIIDRYQQGYVIDFIDLYISTHHWPAFNIADTAITAGALTLAYHLLLSPKKQS